MSFGKKRKSVFSTKIEMISIATFRFEYEDDYENKFRSLNVMCLSSTENSFSQSFSYSNLKVATY